MSAVVFQTAFLGDLVLTTPLIERLARDGPVDVVVTPASAPLLANHPAVRETIVFDKRGVDRGWGGVLRVAARVRALGAGAAYLAQGSVRTAAIARLAGIPVRIGFSSSPGRVLYTRRVPFDPALHHSARLLSLADTSRQASQSAVVHGTLDTALDAGTLRGVDKITTRSAARPSLYPSDADRSTVMSLLASHGVDATARLIVLAPGSVWATKRWPYYADLARALGASARFRGTPIVVMGGAADAPLAGEIAAAVMALDDPAPSDRQRHSVPQSPVVDACGKLSLLQSTALLERASLVVTNDSAPQHLASAANAPTVTVYGPTVPAFGFGPLADRHATPGHPTLSCRPCDSHGPQRCPLEHWRCMRELSPDAIAAVADRVAGGGETALP